jgi:hypothetical protein
MRRRPWCEHLYLHLCNGPDNLSDSHAASNTFSKKDQESVSSVFSNLCPLCLFDCHDISVDSLLYKFSYQRSDWLFGRYNCILFGEKSGYGSCLQLRCGFFNRTNPLLFLKSVLAEIKKVIGQNKVKKKPLSS